VGALPSRSGLRAALEIEATPPRRFVADDREVARTAANQAALAIERLELIEHLREENVIGDFLDDLAAEVPAADIAVRARRLSVDLTAPHVVLTALATTTDVADDWADRLEAEILRHSPGALLDRRGDLVRGLLRAPGSDQPSLIDAIQSAHRAVDAALAVGLSGIFVGLDGAASAFIESQQAAVAASLSDGGPPVRAISELGAYRYLLQLREDVPERDPLVAAARTLAAYDGERSTALLRTLAEYLRHRGNVRASSEALYVHPNTLRQRLSRIRGLTGLNLDAEDWLALEIAVRLVVLDGLPATPG
jgi:purine catabolism regulator